MTAFVAIDLGGTHIRFALGEAQGGRVSTLGAPTVLPSHGFPDFAAAFTHFAAGLSGPTPKAAALAVAGPVHQGPFKLTNLDWVIDREALQAALGLETLLVLNDFAAVGHAVAQLADTHFLPLSGPAKPLLAARHISIIGPGTGLGVAQVIRGPERYAVIPTEGGHVGYAPADAEDDGVLALARARFGRVSAERILSGAGLALIYEALTGHAPPYPDDAGLWQAALTGNDEAAATALERFCLGLGRFAGDIALAHGADAVVVAGGLGLRLGDRLSGGPFAQGFYDKGRFAGIMQSLPVMLVTEPQPGLYGAAAAFAQEFQG